VQNPTAVVQHKDSEWDLHGDEDDVNADDAAILARYDVLDDLGPLEVTAVVALAADDKAGQEEDAAAVEADLGGDAAPVLHAMCRRSRR